MELKGTGFRFVALFAVFLALGVVATSQATMVSASTLTSIQDAEDPDATEDAIDDTGEVGTPVVDTTDTGVGGTTGTGADAALPDTGTGSGGVSANGGMVVALLGAVALIVGAAAIITRRRESSLS